MKTEFMSKIAGRTDGRRNGENGQAGPTDEEAKQNKQAGLKDEEAEQINRHAGQ